MSDKSEEIIKLHLEGKRIKEIARISDVSKQYVDQVLIKNNLRPNMNKQSNEITDDIASKIIELHAKGYPSKMISDELFNNISTYKIDKYLIENKLKPITIKEYKDSVINNEIIKYHNLGLLPYEIARKINLTEVTIRYKLKNLDIKPNSRMNSPAGEIKKD